MSAESAVPKVSVGLAVRNDPEQVRRCIESVLSQRLTDLELVICDNASDDDTVDTLEEYARQDRRVRVSVNPVNIGLQPNVNRVFELSRGVYFRWISADDWLEPDALSECVAALEHRRDAVGVTSDFTIHSPGNPARYEQYAGEFPDSSDPSRRFERMLWFFHAGDAKYDPVYGVFHRQQLLGSGLHRPNEKTDWLLSAEMALIGPILHIHELLAHRTRTYSTGVDHAAFRRRLNPAYGERIKATPTSLSREMYALAQSASLTEAQLRRCRRAVRRFWLGEVRRISRLRLSDTAHRALRH